MAMPDPTTAVLRPGMLVENVNWPGTYRIESVDLASGSMLVRKQLGDWPYRLEALMSQRELVTDQWRVTNRI